MAQGQGLGLLSLVLLVSIIGALSAPNFKPALGPETKETTPHATTEPVTGATQQVNVVAQQVEHERQSAEGQASDQQLDRAFSALIHELFPDEVPLGATDPVSIAVALRGRPKLVPIIVGVPDPQQSHMALYYDQTMGALREAAAKIGYVPSEFSLPWQDALRLRPMRGAEPHKAGATDLEAQPGLILFRRDSQLPAQTTPTCPTQDDELIVALLVLESSVLGPKMEQLEGALGFAQQIAQVDGAALRSLGDDDACTARPRVEEAQHIHLLGPFFSGSAIAYRAALTKQPMPALMVTGTATSSAVDKTLSSSVEFERVVPTDDRLSDWVKKELWWRAVPLKDRVSEWLWSRVRSPQPDCPDDSPWENMISRPYLAELTETGTGYGQTVDDDENTALNKPQAECKRKAGVTPKDDQNRNIAAKVTNADLHFGFPLHISEIRAERELVLAQQAELFPSIRRTLGLKLNPDEEQESDVPATLSSLTPYDDDLTLGQELSHICDRHFRYVMVEATDPVDVIFLAQQMRKFCRDMVLVTLGYDDLFVHPDLGSTMSGTIVASPFAPSFAISSFVDGHTTHPFPNSVSQGFFNAFLRIAAEAGAATPDDGQPIGASESFFLGEIAGAKIWPTRIVSRGAPPPNLDALSPPETQRERLLSSAPPANKVRFFAWPVLFVGVIHIWLRFNRRGMFCGVGSRFKRFRRVRLAVADASLMLLILLTALPLTYLVKDATWGLQGSFSGYLLGSNRCIVAIDTLLVLTLLVWIAGLTGVPQSALGKLGRFLDRRLKVKADGRRSFAPPSLRRWLRRTLAMFLARARTDENPTAPSTVARANCVAGRANKQCARPAAHQALVLATQPCQCRLGEASNVLSSTVEPHATCTDEREDPSRRRRKSAPSLLPLNDSVSHRAERFGSWVALLGVAVLVLAVAAGFWNLGPAYFASAEAAPYTGTLRWFRIFDPFAMSSAMPFVYLVTAVYLWSLFALIRIARLDRFPHRLPAPFASRATVPRRTLRAVCQELQSPWSETRAWGLPITLYLFCMWRLFLQIEPTVEGTGFDLGYRLEFAVVALFLLAELVRFVTLSRCLLQFLRDLAAEPMIDAYDRIAGKVAGSFGLQLSARVPNPEDFQVSVLTARALTTLGAKEFLVTSLGEATHEVEQSMAALNASRSKSANPQRRVHEALMRFAGELHENLILRWKRRAGTPQVESLWSDVSPKDLLPGGGHGRSPTAMVLMAALPREEYVWIRAAEDFVALRTSTFIYQVLHELRHTLTFALVASTLLAMSMVCYPFQPARFLALAVWSTVVAVAGIGLWRMLALERNEVLSRLSKTQPDRIEWNAAFVRQIALYVVLPLAAALIGLFPGVGDAIAAHLAPIVRLLPVAT